MDQIVFSCNYFVQGCQEEFLIHSLQNLLFHQLKCKRDKAKPATTHSGISTIFYHSREVRKETTGHTKTSKSEGGRVIYNFY